MKRVLLLTPLFLAGCGTVIAPRGTTHVYMEGSLCGAPVKLRLADGKERAAFTARAKCADGSIVTVTSSESAAFEGQAQGDQMNAQLLGLVQRLLPLVIPSVPQR